MFAAAAVLAIMVLLVLASNQTTGPSGRSACSQGLPSFAATADLATINPVNRDDSDLSLALAARDASMTLVGFCSKSGKLPAVAPRLVQTGLHLAPGGGVLEESSDGSRLLFIFATTKAPDMSVVQDQLQLGDITFRGTPTSVCPTPVSTGVVLACGAIYALEVEFPIEAKADEIVGVDGIVEAERPGGANLGFYFFGARAGSAGPLLSIGFNRPTGSVVVVALREVYLAGRTIDVRGMSLDQRVPAGGG